MSMIRCPNCHNEISDKAEKCVHCGFNLKDNIEMICPDCGEIILAGMTVCPKCGYPVKHWHEPPESEKRKNNIGILVAIVLVVAGIAYLFYAKVQYERDTAYHDTTDAVYEALSVGLDPVSECPDLIMKVWNNAIWKIQDDDSDKYVQPNGVFVDDFRDALESLYADPDFAQKLEIIAEQQKELRKLKRDLENPPEEMADYNDLLIDMIDCYIAISTLTLNPSGSYLEVQIQYSALVAELTELVMEMDAYME